MDEQQKKIVKRVVGVVLGLIAVMILNPFTIVGAGQRGVVLRLGAVNRVMTEGLSLHMPLFESVEKLDVRTQKEEVEVSAASKDLQIVTANIALNYNLMPDKVTELWQQIGESYKIRIIDPAIQESVKAATAKYTADELITKRELVKEAIQLSLAERLVKEFIQVTEVSITDFDFSESFNVAIEKKVTAEQDALAAKNKLEQVKFEADQRVAQAEAEARAIRLQSDAANSDKYVRLKQLEVQLEFAKRWNGSLPQNLYGSAPIPFLQIGE